MLCSKSKDADGEFGYAAQGIGNINAETVEAGERDGQAATKKRANARVESEIAQSRFVSVVVTSVKTSGQNAAEKRRNARVYAS